MNPMEEQLKVEAEVNRLLGNIASFGPQTGRSLIATSEAVAECLKTKRMSPGARYQLEQYRGALETVISVSTRHMAVVINKLGILIDEAK